jgi:hypothetical protein
MMTVLFLYCTKRGKRRNKIALKIGYWEPVTEEIEA